MIEAELENYKLSNILLRSEYEEIMKENPQSSCRIEAFIEEASKQSG